MNNKTEMLATADAMIEQLKEYEQDKLKFKEIASERINTINALLEDKLYKLDKSIEDIKFNLLQIANMSTLKETKTQKKLELLNGDVIIKKATKKLKNDNEKILKAIKESRKDLVKKQVTTEVKLDWAGFKKELKIQDDGSIINITTGEVVEIAGLEVEDVPERLEVN